MLHFRTNGCIPTRRLANLLAWFENGSLTEKRIIMAEVGSTARTGETCPESGVWEVLGSPSTTAPIAKGNTMPPYANKSVTWKLIRKA